MILLLILLQDLWEEAADGLQVTFAIRSHQRPAEALKTYQMLRSLTDAPIKVYVEESQMPMYQREFSGFAHAVVQGALGSGANIWHIIKETFEQVEPGTGPLGLVVTDDNLTGIRFVTQLRTCVKHVPNDLHCLSMLAWSLFDDAAVVGTILTAGGFFWLCEASDCSR
jgi:hypothetical protein